MPSNKETPTEQIARLEEENRQLHQRLAKPSYPEIPASWPAIAFPVGIFRTDPQGNCVYVNPRWCEISGMSHAQALGQGWIAAIHREDRQRVFTEWEKSCQNKHLFQMEYRFQSPSGTVTWVLGQSEVELDIHGEVIGYVGTITDINDRKQAEKSLKTSLQILEAHFYNSPLAIIEWDRNHHVVRWSKQAEQIFGWSEEEIKIMDIERWQFVHIEDQKRVSNHMNALRNKTISSLSIQNRNYTKSGRVITCKWNSTMILDEAGQMQSLLSFAEDITERIMAQEALAQSEARFQKIALSSPMGIYIQVLYVDGSTRFEYISPAGAEIFEETVEELLQETNFRINIVNDQDREVYQAALDHSIQNLAPFFCELQIMTKSGKTKWIQASDRPELREDGSIAWYGVFLDVTARKQTEEALHKSEARLREAEQVAHVGNWELDRRTNTMQWSNEIYRILEITPKASAPAHQEFMSLVHPEDRDWVEQVCIEADKNHTLADLIYRLQLPDGRIKYIQEYGQTFYNAQNQAVRSFGTLQDITARIQAERALQHLVEGTAAVTGKEFFTALVSYLATTLDVSTVLVTELIDDHLQTRAFWFNQQLQPTFKYFPLKAPCQSTLDKKIYFCSAQVQQHFPEDPNLVSLQSESYLGIALTNLEGSSIGVLCILDHKPLLNVSWLQSILQIFAARISAELERERAMQALEDLNQQLELKIEERTADLRQSEERWHLALKGTNDGIWDWHICGSRIFLSSRWKEMRGFSETEIGEDLQEWTSRIHPEDFDLVMTAVKEHFDGEKEFFDVEYRAQRKDGSYMWVLSRGQALHSPTGKILRMLGSETDITQRKQYESELKQANEDLARQMLELQRMDQLKNDFMSTVSHELRTPLSNMNMAIKLLKMSDMNPATYAKYLNILDLECQREISLINDLLDLQRLEAGKKELSQDFIELSQWLPTVFSSFKERTSIRNQCLIGMIPPNLPPLLTDISSLERILMELLNNACKYSPDGGIIQVKLIQKVTYIVFEVINNGIGISREELPFIFDKFYRIPNGDPWHQGGTGLGLALVKRLIENLQGTIEVSSQDGETNFTFTIPMVDKNIPLPHAYREPS